MSATDIPNTLSQRALRNHSSDVLRRVQSGESFVITVHGDPVARIVPLTRAEPRLPVARPATRRGRFVVPGDEPVNSDETVDIDEQVDEEALR